MKLLLLLTVSIVPLLLQLLPAHVLLLRTLQLLLLCLIVLLAALQAIYSRLCPCCSCCSTGLVVRAGPVRPILLLLMLAVGLRSKNLMTCVLRVPMLQVLMVLLLVCAAAVLSCMPAVTWLVPVGRLQDPQDTCACVQAVQIVLLRKYERDWLSKVFALQRSDARGHGLAVTLALNTHTTVTKRDSCAKDLQHTCCVVGDVNVHRYSPETYQLPGSVLG